MITYIARISSLFDTWSSRKRTLLVAGLGVLAVAVTVGSVTLTIRAHEGRSQEDTRQQALTQAAQLVPDILSYDFNTVDDHFTGSLEHLGGEFRTQFESVSKDVIIPSAKQRQVVTSATVVESSVVSASADAATVLMFLNQSTTSTDSPAPKLDGSRVQVSLHRDGDSWQITEMSPV
ncbi:MULTISPECIES: hypothetical protein [Rhodococcus]|uniref:Hypothetical membrane protein n=2 Tax=Rhodococcus opacus TaxID=37919 RepID=C1BDE6_RHOOB|nr:MULTISPECIES: hypothetical protein [Rhodococcus]EID79023.1 putative membrane protein [Rhodococcus opacus RKJ300 = JCM 13270]KAF0960423.1 hypothetical protein MLGJGCBP_06438 [Rhodococcus sp. T7]QQZ18277.1 hypothetical protein GO592_39325 [Rhodococcus sp. 21391]UOT08217.1 hypothetical protein MPY17_38440 [Rhodococcus opacus]BAH55890.1 hypothetical membrane protein [Rhodococcus opacus B4]